MKILFCIAGLPAGGGERQFLRLVNGLHKRGHDVVVHVFGTQAKVHFKSIFENDYTVFFSEISRKNIYFAPFIILSDLHKICKEHKPDLIYGMLFKASCAVRIYKILTQFKIKVISTIRNDFAKSYPWWQKIFEKILISQSDALITNHFPTYSAFQKQHFKISTFFIPNGINLEDLDVSASKKNGDEKTLNLISVGRLYLPWKKQDVLLEALKNIRFNNPNIKFMCKIFGEGRDKNLLLDLIKKYALEQNVKILDPAENIEQYISSSDVLIHNSVVEGFPNVVLEAMALKVPVIVSKYVGDLGIIENKLSGIIADGNDSFALEKAIKEFECMTKSQRDEIIKNASNVVLKKFSSDEMISRHLDVFLKVIEK